MIDRHVQRATLLSALLFFSCAAVSDTPSPQRSDLYGALIVSSNYRYYAAILYGSASEARHSALASCQKDEPQAICTVYAAFKNQCIAVAASGFHHFVATGKEDWDLRQTREYSLHLCRKQAGSECRLVISASSTQAQKAEDQTIKAGRDAPLIESFQTYPAPLALR